MIKPYQYIIILGVAVLSSCNLFVSEEDKGVAIARVNETYLYLNDVEDIIPVELSEGDSILFLENYIYKWGQQQLILEKAKYNLSEKDQDFNTLVEEYRNDLIKFAYQQVYVDKHLDTSITEEELLTYYSENPQNFELKENILKADYIIFDSDTPELDQARRWFTSSREKYQDKFHDFAMKFAVVYIYSDTSWIPFEEMAKTIPIKTYNQQEFLSKNNNVYLEDSLSTYFLRINSFKIKDDVSPLTYVKPTVKSIILNRRKLELIKKMEDEIFEDAYEKKEFEIF